MPIDSPEMTPLDYNLPDSVLFHETGISDSCMVWVPDTVMVVIGNGSSPDKELHLDRITEDGIPVYRRSSGGCAVVLDPGNVLVALGLPLDGVGGITTAFAAISTWLAAVLDACGVPEIRKAGTSDLAVGDRKIGGSCVWRTRGLLYYATTLLVRPDLDLVDRYLQHPPREPDWRRGRQHRDFMGRLPARVGRRGADAVAGELQSALAASRLLDTQIRVLD